jgi:osmotically-inducible protein OsmY
MKTEKLEFRWTSAVVVFLMVVGGVAMQTRSGSYDYQIRAEVAQVLERNNAYHNVKATVEDSVVFLVGNVELDSTREALITRTRRIPHVESVESNVVLSPPAVPDQTLFARVQRTVADAGFGEVQFRVHEGAVVLEGTVRNFKERQRLLELVQATDGVKEVTAIALIIAE